MVKKRGFLGAKHIAAQICHHGNEAKRAESCTDGAHVMGKWHRLVTTTACGVMGSTNSRTKGIELARRAIR